MIILIIIAMANFVYEWSFLQRNNRKKRTKWIVFSIMGVSYLYCSATVLFPGMPSPNIFIQFIFGPLQQKILR